MPKLRLDLYYFCGKRKSSATLEKIRRYCSPVGCRHLMTRPKENRKQSSLRRALKKRKWELVD